MFFFLSVNLFIFKLNVFMPFVMSLCHSQDTKISTKVTRVHLLCIGNQLGCFISKILKSFPILLSPSTIHKLSDNPALSFHCRLYLSCYPGWILIIETKKSVRNVHFYNAMQFTCKTSTILSTRRPWNGDGQLVCCREVLMDWISDIK